MMRIAFALAAMLAALPAAAQPQQQWRLTPDGLGPVRIGMTRAQVSAALNARLEGEPIEDADVCVEMTARGKLPGVHFMFVDRLLSRISLGRPSRITTPRGIGAGATEAQVRAAYGRGLRSEPHQYEDAPARYLTFWVRPDVRGVRFETDRQRRVRTIHAGTDSIGYVEGCA